MCAKYVFRSDESIVEDIQRRYGNNLEECAYTGGTIVPTTLAPVRCRDRHNNPGTFLMRFGFRMNQTMIINARSETVDEKPLFRMLTHQHRCLIPANSYTEWQHIGKQRIPYRFESLTFPVLFFAGLYRLDPGTRFANFVILTRNAAEPFAGIHDRMPLILSPEEQAAWLDPAADYRSVLCSGLTDLVYSQADA